MAKIRKSKLSWKPSESDLVAGYKLYWSSKSPVTYNSNCIKLGKINELNLPDVLVGIAPSGVSIFLGISAIDEKGNESDLVALSESYIFSVPPAPADFSLISQDDFKITEQKQQDKKQIQDFQHRDIKQNEESIELETLRPPVKYATSEGRIIDDFGVRINKIFEKKG